MICQYVRYMQMNVRFMQMNVRYLQMNVRYLQIKHRIFGMDIISSIILKTYPSAAEILLAPLFVDKLVKFIFAPFLSLFLFLD